MQSNGDKQVDEGTEQIHVMRTRSQRTLDAKKKEKQKNVRARRGKRRIASLILDRRAACTISRNVYIFIGTKDRAGCCEHALLVSPRKTILLISRKVGRVAEGREGRSGTLRVPGVAHAGGEKRQSHGPRHASPFVEKRRG